MNDPRVVRWSDGTTRLERMPDVAEHDFDLIVLIDSPGLAQRTLINLANITYPRLRVIFVFSSAAGKDNFHALLCCMRESLPRYSLFVPKSPLEIAEMKSAGLQSVKAPHYGLLYGGDSVHPKVFDRVSAALVDNPTADGIKVGSARLNAFSWYTEDHRDTGRLIVYRTDAVMQRGGYRAMDIHEYDSEWRLQRLLAAGIVELPELLFFRSPRTSDVIAGQQYSVFEEAPL
ncbi:MAG TPA: hypothetical protein VLT59_05280 [Steroidobacteraceae bacterium]|nr:hypothetical protein [Steroidobacteraceae bacterium]